MWALESGRQSLPADPRTVALYLGHLAADGKAMATIALARAAISHAHAAAGTAKGDNPARHSVVAEMIKGWRNQAPAQKQAGALTSQALTRIRETVRLPRRGRGGRMETPAAALARAAVALAIIGVLADGGLRRSEAAALTWGDVEYYEDGTARITIQRGKNQPAPATVAVTENTARALHEIQPHGIDPGTPVFGLTGRRWPTGCELWLGPQAWAKTSPDTAAGSAWPGGWWRRGRPTRRCSARAGGSTATWWPATPGARRPGRRSSG